MLAMRKQMPDHPRPFRLGDKWVWVIGFLALWSTNLIVYCTGWDTNWKLFLAIILGYVLMAVYYSVAKQKTPPLDFKHGWWLLVWYAGLAVISFLGDYPEQKEKAGNLGVLDFNLGAVACLGLTALVIWLALRSALPSERVEEILSQQNADEEAPPAH